MLVKIKNVEMDLTDQAIKVSSQQVHPGERQRLNQIKKKKRFSKPVIWPHLLPRKYKVAWANLTTHEITVSM